MKNKRLFIAVLTLFLLFLPLTVQAQAPARVDAFVFGATSFDGLIYQTSFVPPSIDTIYQLANVKNVITPRSTLIYFWPLTNRYEADWSMKNEIVDGKLEILSQNRVVLSSALETYIVQYDEADPEASLELYTGGQADQAWKNFQALQASYRDRLFKYYEDYEVYRNKVDELTTKATRENRTIPESEWPVAPKQVEPLSVYSSELARGFIINLPEGEYQVQLRLAGGSIQVGSQKRLVVFSKIQDGISYKVVPRSRWTEPATAVDPGGVIYSPPGTNLYLTPYLEFQFDEFTYNHMLDPQSTTPPGSGKTWVAYQPVADSKLFIQKVSGETARIDLKAYTVQQTAGQGLGYEVQEFDPEKHNNSSFRGFELKLDQSNPEYVIELEDLKGKSLSGSSRVVRSLNTQRGIELYFLAGLPILVGIYMLFARRRSARAIKVKEG